MGRISRIISVSLTRFYYIPLLMVVSALVVSICYSNLDLLDFSDPTIGFQSRGTDLSNKLVTYKNLQREEDSYFGSLTSNPKRFIENEQPKIKTKTKKHKKNKKKVRNKRRLNYRERRLGFFCDNPYEDLVELFVEKNSNSVENFELFSLEGLLELCRLHDDVSTLPSYQEYCDKDNSYSTRNCCRPFSLANVVAFYGNKSSCNKITLEDVNILIEKIEMCRPYYQNRTLLQCAGNNCTIPEDCATSGIIYNVFRYMGDRNSLNGFANRIKYTVVYLPLTKGPDLLSFYTDFVQLTFHERPIQIIASNFGLENEWFELRLMKDVIYIIMSAIIILCLFWFYSNSLIITIIMMAQFAMTVIISFYIYGNVLRIKLFPFVNMLAVIIIVGIGADNAFLFIYNWNMNIKKVLEGKRNNETNEVNEPLQSNGTDNLNSDRKIADKRQLRLNCENLYDIMYYTLEQILRSMTVTAGTTFVAFIITAVFSTITAIKCFGIFAAITVLVNYFLLLTWFSIWMYFYTRVVYNWCKLRTNSNSNYKIVQMVSALKERVKQSLLRLEEFTLNGIIKSKYFIGIIFGLLGVYGVIITLTNGLKVPNSKDFQMFIDDHPFRIYKSLQKEFDYADTNENQILAQYHFPVRFIWGVIPHDDGDFYTAEIKGSLRYDTTFNVSSETAQEWLYSFCERVKKLDWIETVSDYAPNCFVQSMVMIMKNRECWNRMTKQDITPCCKISTFPYQSNVFMDCLPDIVYLMKDIPVYDFLYGVTSAGPKFLRPIKNRTSTSPIKAIVLEYKSTQQITYSYGAVHELTNIMMKFFEEQLISAPTGLKNGFAISTVDYYAVQESLSFDTKTSIIWCSVLSFGFLLIVTGDIIISMLSILTVFLTICVTIAILIGMNWELNILESIAITSSIGLAVDFSLHYTIHYVLCRDRNLNREDAAKHSLLQMYKPSLMAAFTTAIAGSCLLLSELIPYVQIGIFLIVIMSVSWTYATFFLISCLAIMGPIRDFGTIGWIWKQIISINYIHRLMECCNLQNGWQLCKRSTRRTQSQAQAEVTDTVDLRQL